jgi:phosphatidylethanolamine-binding protein (PEBP) family uncharacterized protein
MKTHRRFLTANVFSLALAIGAFGCSSSEPADPGNTGGSPNTGGSKAGGTGGSTSTGTGGTSNTGGSSAGGSGAGGSSATGGSSGSGGSTGSGGSATGGGGGSATGGSTGSGGTSGVPDGGGSETGGGDGPVSTGDFKLDVKGFMVVGGKNLFPDSATHPGGDHSPAMDFLNPPAEVKSFAVSLVDMQGMPVTADGKFHWILWDIPASTKGLATDLPKVSPLTMPPEVMGAKQLNLTGGKAYFGPGAGGSRPYKFQLWALDVATLPVQNMTLAAIFGLLKQHKIGTVPQFDGVGYK